MTSNLQEGARADVDSLTQIANTYRRMAQEGRYRPAAPSDGFGNITRPVEELDLDAEARAYAARWWAQEDDRHFWVGCCNYTTRAATIFAIEAARLLCGCSGEGHALRLLKMAVADLEANGVEAAP
jgi:hypothetical protein